MRPVLSDDQRDFMRRERASSFGPGVGARDGKVFVYRSETFGTWRWLIDRAATITESEFFAFENHPR